MARTEREIRSDFKQKLLKRNIIPYSSPYTKNHEKIIDMLKASKYSEIKEYVMELYNIDIDKRFHQPREKRAPNKLDNTKPDKNKLVKIRILRKLLNYDLVSEDDDNARDIQKEIKNRVLTENTTAYNLAKEYLDHANDICKQKFQYERLRSTVLGRKEKGIFWNISPEDIIINEYCPFFGTKLTYVHMAKDNLTLNDTTASNDRFDNSKGYIKGNVWVISRLANTVKNKVTIEQLKTFCHNVLKKFYENNPDYRF